MNDDNFSSTFSANARLSSDTVIRSIETSLPAVDLARNERHDQLALLRDAKAGSLSKEQRLLAIKSGADHPRIALAADAFAANENLRREIAVVREVVESPAPAVDAGSFVVYGFVRRRSTQAGVPGLTLALSDEQGTWIRRFGYACTDRRGYFALTIKLEDSEKAPVVVDPESQLTDEEKKKYEAEKARAAATGAPAPVESSYTPRAASTSTTSDTTRLSTILRVFSREGRTIHTGKNPVIVKAGALDYRVIFLDEGDEDCGCTPPPAQSNGKPDPAGPSANQPPSAETPLKPSTTSAPQERVGDLKSYQAVTPAAPPPATPPTTTGQPLEAIRGIGPKSAGKLRAAGIADVSAFEKTEGKKLVDLAGFDKTPPKKSATPRKKTAPVVGKSTLTKTRKTAAPVKARKAPK